MRLNNFPLPVISSYLALPSPFFLSFGFFNHSPWEALGNTSLQGNVFPASLDASDNKKSHTARPGSVRLGTERQALWPTGTGIAVARAFHCHLQTVTHHAEARTFPHAQCCFCCLSWPPLSQFNTIHTLFLRERKRKSSLSLMGSRREEFLGVPPDMLGESWFWCVFLLSVKLAFCSAYWAIDERLGRSHRDPYRGREELGLLSLTRFACQLQMPEIFNTC